ncbi:hypothetical protein L1049_020468 [Liquidambar formosana]|uniref:Membrane-associated kinase regulator 6 n=1 Tax=Liquidambar formosana TaxID=63359 RepID=A0AAP0XAR8_LIQFO
MENSRPLSIESFSYSWLINLKPSFESLDDSLRASLDVSDEASFIEMDPRLPPSKRFLRDARDFNFDFPISQSPLTIVHADELFSNGLIMPFFVDPLKMEAYDALDTIPTSPNSSHAPKIVLSASEIRCPSLRRCRRLSKRIIQKYLDFLRPLFQRIRGRRSGVRPETFDTRSEVVKNRVYSVESSPRRSVTYCLDDWRKSCDSESSIYEAVLHCKKSIGLDVVWYCFVIYRKMNCGCCTLQRGKVKKGKERRGKERSSSDIHGKKGGNERSPADHQSLVLCPFLLSLDDNVNLSF